MRVLIVDDHPIVSEALRGILEEIDAALHCRQVERFEGVPELLAGDDFDLLLLDLQVPGTEGLSGLLTLRECVPDIPTVVVSHHDDRDTIERCLACGASGFIPKSSSKEIIRRAVELVLAGGIFVPAQALRQVAAEAVAEAADGGGEAAPEALTERQRRVLQMMMEGHSNKQIAYRLGISEWTVKAHVSAVLRKLRVHNRVAAVLAARQLGMAPAAVD